MGEEYRRHLEEGIAVDHEIWVAIGALISSINLEALKAQATSVMGKPCLECYPVAHGTFLLYLQCLEHLLTLNRGL